MTKKKRSKYNAKKVIVDGIKFDSKAEAEYYQHLLELKKKGEVVDFKIQPSYELQPAYFMKDGKRVLPITYKADFLVSYPDGTLKVIDIKGMETPVFNLKKKMFGYHYPNHELVLICKAPLYLSPVKWIELEELKKIRKARKKAKEENG